MINYFIPWLGGELNVKSTIRPLEIAYNAYMRTFTGCIISTPIPLLYAISKFPLLQDTIMTASSIIMLKAEAQGNLLGDDNRRWDRTGCDLDGWTPFGQIRVAIDRRAKNMRLKSIPRQSQNLQYKKN